MSDDQQLPTEPADPANLPAAEQSMKSYGGDLQPPTEGHNSPEAKKSGGDNTQ